MLDKEQIRSIVRQMNYSLSEEDVTAKTEMIYVEIGKKNYDFSNYEKNVITQQRKKRMVYNFPSLSTESVVCQYLKRQLDKVFHINYASRSKIINVLFNILPVIKDMNDFIIVRADFKSFFDRVLTRHVYNQYICASLMNRSDKEMLKRYVVQFKYCYAGLCLSNGLTEIICRDFDERIKAKLSANGLFFYERYVDDILIIMNKYISQSQFLENINAVIKDVFGECPVELNMSPGKFSYISRRNLSTVQEFNFLGYEYQIRQDTINKKICILYGISEKKRKKYTGIIERAFIQYKQDRNIELFRQRLKIYSARVVIAKTIGSSSFDWLTKGVVANYNELRFHMDSLIPHTEKFLKGIYFELLKVHGCSIPYFLKQSASEESIYNLYSNMSRNRTLMFEENIGVSRKTLLQWIQRLDPYYTGNRKNYYRIVVDYLEKIKVE